MPQSLVIDASVLAKLFIRDAKEQYIDKADLLFSKFENGEVSLFAPYVIVYEVGAALVKAIQQARVGEERGMQAIHSFQKLGLVILEDSEAAREEAFRLAIRYHCPHYYDALYLALAEDLDCPFVTADDKLWRQVQARVSYLIRLAHYG